MKKKHPHIHTHTVGLLIHYNETSSLDNRISQSFQYGVTILLLILNGSLVFIPIVIILYAVVMDADWSDVFKSCKKCSDEQGIRESYA